MTDPVVEADFQPDRNWEPWNHGDPFESTNGTIFRALNFVPDDQEHVRIGFHIRPENCNFLGGCHGGLIAALLDIAMGRNVLAAIGVVGAPTMSMTVDFVRGAKAGDWLESRVRIIRQARRVVFCDALLIGAAGTIARASGVFSIPRPTHDSQNT